MGSAALALFLLKAGIVSSAGVMFGWQPMPDGSESYEYVVQIEPELAATLQEGQSIPITSDIPRDIGPIGRIRIVVGRDELPREKLVTRFKPWPKKLSDEGLVDTQHRVPPVEPTGGDRYPAQAVNNNTILPPSNTPRVASNPFGQALQQGAQEASNLANQAKEQILPRADQLFGSGSTADQNVRTAINNRTDQLRQNAQQGIERATGQAGQAINNAVNDFGQRANNAIDKFARPDSQQRSILNTPSGSSAGRIFPPNNGAGAQAINSSITPKGRRIDTPVQEQQAPAWPQDRNPPGSSFAAAPPAVTNQNSQLNPTSQPGVFNAPWPSTSSNVANDSQLNRRNERQDYLPASNNAPSSGQQQSRDSINLANRGTNPTPRNFDNRGYNENRPPQTRVADVNFEGPKFPQGGPQQQTTPPYRNDDWPQQPAPMNPPRNDIATNQGGTQVVSAKPGFNDSMQTEQSYVPQERDLGLRAAGSGEGQANTQMMPLLLSWVLLTGSGVGNAFLWWSYLDVRNKYQGVVHGSSPGRYDRYDD